MEITLVFRSPIQFFRKSHRHTTHQGTQRTTTGASQEARRREPTIQPNIPDDKKSSGSVQSDAVSHRHNMDTVPNRTREYQNNQRQTHSEFGEGANKQDAISMSASHSNGRKPDGHFARAKRKTMGLSKTKIVFLGVLLGLSIQFFGWVVFKENYINQLLATFSKTQLTDNAIMAVTIAGIYTSIHIIWGEYFFPFMLLLILVLSAIVYGSV